MNRPWSKVFESSVENHCAFLVSSWTNFSTVIDKQTLYNSYIDVDKIVCPFSLVVGLQDRWQPMREDQLALRTNDRWLPEGKRPRTNEK